MIRSKALEVNIADYHVDVEIDPKYAVLQEIMSAYYGLREGLATFLKELSHPYKNWQFIVREARTYALFTREPRRGGTTYKLGVMPLTGCGHAAWALGVLVVLLAAASTQVHPQHLWERIG